MKQSQEAAERKKSMLERLSKAASKVSTTANKANDKIDVKSQKMEHPIVRTISEAFIVDPEVLDAVNMQNKVYFCDDYDSESSRTFSHSYSRLASVLVEMAKKKSICLLLSWPKGIEWLGGVHFLANRATVQLSKGGGDGIRMLLYPVSRTSYKYYRQTYVPSAQFVEEARYQANQRRSGGIIGDLSRRDHAFLTLNNIDANDKLSIMTVTPVFEWGGSEDNWAKVGGRYLNELSSKLWFSGVSVRREKVNEYAEVQDNPSLSEGPCFNVGKDTSPAEVRELRQKHNRNIDIVALDASVSNLYKTRGLRSSILKFVENYFDEEDHPSLLICTDDPLVYSRYKLDIESFIKQNKTVSASSLKLIHLLKSSVGSWEDADDVYENKILESTNFIIKASGISLVQKLQSINKYAARIGKESEQGKRLLMKLGGFVRMMSEIPVGQSNVREWLVEHTKHESAPIAQRKLACSVWESYKQDLIGILSESGLSENYNVKKAIEIADGIAETVEKGTEVQLDLEEFFIGRYHEGKRVLVAVPYKYQVRIIEKILEGLYDNLEKDVNVCSVSDVLEFEKYDVVLIAGMAEKFVPKLLLLPNMPDKICLYVSAYGAIKLEKILKVLASIPNYKSIHERVNALLTELDTILSSVRNIEFSHAAEKYRENYVVRKSLEQSEAQPVAYLSLAGYEELYPVTKFQTILKLRKGKSNSFYLAKIDDMKEGDQLVVLDDDIRVKMENYLERECSRHELDSKELLSYYFNQAKSNLSSFYPQKYRSERAAAIHEKISEIDRIVAQEISINMITRWVKWIEDTDVWEEEDLQTNSAQNMNHFLLFAEALYFDPKLAETIYIFGIKKYRGSRINAGRDVGAKLRSMLTEISRPESLGLTRSQQDELLTIAGNSLYTIESIIYTEEDELD